MGILARLRVRKRSGSGRAGRTALALPLRAGGALLTAVFLLLPGLFPSASGLAAQQVEFTPRPDVPEERRLARFIGTGDYDLLVRDSVVRGDVPVERSLLVLGARVRLEGGVPGDVYVVDGDFFLRPGSRVDGDVVVLGGGFYSSGLAEVGGERVYLPNLLLRVQERNGVFVISHAEDEPEAFSLHGLHGFRFPFYQRVDGWTPRWGGRARAVDLPLQPELDGTVRFPVEREELEGSVAARLHPAGALRLGFEAERRARTRDDWIRGDVSNTFSFLLGAGDHRNYYLANAAAFRLETRRPLGFNFDFAVGWEEARSLEARSLFVLFADDDDVRPNPSADEGDTWSAEVGATYRHRRGDHRFIAGVRVEAADSTVAGDFSFLLGEARAAWSRGAPGPGRLQLFGIARGDLAGTTPRQRWSALGGRATLPTLGLLERTGSRLLFGETSYLIPVEPLRASVLGAPTIVLRHSIGATWSKGEARAFDNNLAVGLRFLFGEALVAVAPGGGDLDSRFVLGITYPGRFR